VWGNERVMATRRVRDKRFRRSFLGKPLSVRRYSSFFFEGLGIVVGLVDGVSSPICCWD